MEGNSLEYVITENSSSITIRLSEYFLHKEKCSSPRTAAKPVISRDAIEVLHNEVEKCPKFIKWVIDCLEEFMSNKEVEVEWQKYCEDLSELLKICVVCACDDLLDSCHLKNLCGIIFSLGEKGDPLSSALFNACAKKLLNFLLHCPTGEEFELILLASLRTLCLLSEPTKIAAAYNSMHGELDLLAKKIFSLSIEAQISAYFIFSKSLRSSKNALEKVSVWFCEWPELQKAFIDHFPDRLSEGCENFVYSLSKIGIRPLPNASAPPSRRKPCPHIPEKEQEEEEYEKIFQKPGVCAFTVPTSVSEEQKSSLIPPKEQVRKHASRFLLRQGARSVASHKFSFNLLNEREHMQTSNAFEIPPHNKLYYLDSKCEWHFRRIDCPSTPRWPSFKRFKPEEDNLFKQVSE